MENQTNNIIILIDGDNINSKSCKNIYDIAREKGIIVSSKLYGDFSKIEMEQWKDNCNTYGIEPVHVWPISGKNSTDIRMTADGIEMLIDKKDVNIFIIVSGDSDFMTLIMKLKNKSKKIIGMSGYSESTSKSLQNYCDEFYIFNENIEDNESSDSSEINIISTKDINNLRDTVELLLEKSNRSKIDLSEFKYKLLRINPKFNEQNYGCKSFSKLIKSLNICNLTWIDSQVFVSLKK
jgi:uncharacterized protein (TIGR00288 family)